MKHRTVADLMTREVVSVHPDATFKEVAAILTEHDISAVPVTDFQGRVIGVVSEADLMRRLTPRRTRRTLFGGRPASRPARRTRASRVMTTPAVTVDPATDIVTTAQLLASRNIKRAPVVDAEGRLLGVISRHDLIRVFVRSDAEIRDEIRQDVLLAGMLIDPTGIDVTVEQGAVTLRGQVERSSLVPIVSALTGRVDGVVDVDNRLTYAEDDPRYGDGTGPENTGILYHIRPRH